MGKQSEALFQRAQEIIPGGVNSPVRAFKAVGGTPPFIEQGQGSRIFDADNLQYIDCVSSWGPMILGHGHRYVVEAVKRAATRGFSFGAPTRPAFPKTSPGSPSACPTTISTPSPTPWTNTAMTSPPSSSSRWPATWAAFRRQTAFCRDYVRSATSAARF